jgi:hypothetical protein
VRTLALSIGIALAVSTCASSGIVIVDPSGAGYATIQAGINAALEGDIVLVLPATYRGPWNRDLALHGKNIVLLSFYGPETTIIDCEGMCCGITLEAGIDSTSVIDGFTFRNGGALGGSGGAMKSIGAGAVVRNCIFDGNTAGQGGAIRIESEPAPRINHCIFSGNTADLGGAIDVTDADPLIEWCTFYKNVADDGGAIRSTDSAPAITNCTFSSNWGSALSLGASSAVIERSIIAFSESGVAVAGGANSEILHSCIYANAGGDSLDGYHHDNLFVDPLFCDLSTDYHTLCQNSVCLPVNNPWLVQMGSRAQGCGACASPVETRSWGAIKARFR